MSENKKKNNGGPDQPPPDVRSKAGRTVTASTRLNSGKFVPVDDAKRRPSTKVVEAIKKSPPAKKGKKK